MSKRKSLPRWSRQQSRLSIQSHQSQVSGVLNPDSNIATDDEDQPLWFRDFERHSISIRPSARFSLAQDDTPVLASGSEPESTPLQKSWWKNLDRTSGVRASTSNISREESNVPERSNLESSNTSSLDEVVAKKKPALRRNKRKSHQKNIFSEILESPRNSIRSEKIAGDTRDEEKQRTDSSSISYTDTSTENVRKALFRKKKKTKVVRKSENVESKFDKSLPNVFTNVLNASKSTGNTSREAVAPNDPGTFQENQEASLPGSENSAETIRIESKNRWIVSDKSEDTIHTDIMDIDLERSRSPLMMSHRKKRTIFARTKKRRTPNFDDLLDNESKVESVLNESLIRGDEELNRNETLKESFASPSPSLGLQSKTLVGEDESDTDDIIKKQRVPFARKTRNSQKEDMFAQILESPNTSIHSEQASGHAERRSSKKRSHRAETSAAINVELEEDQSAKKPTRLSRGTNEFDFENRSINEENDRAKSSGPVIVQVEKIYSPRQLIRLADVSKRDVNRRSKNKKNIHAEASSSLNVDEEENQSLNISVPPSSVANKSGIERQSTNVKNDVKNDEASSSLNVDEEENQSLNISVPPSSVANKSGIERQSTNVKNDRGEVSDSSYVELEENQSVGSQSRRSIGFTEPRDSIQNPNSSKQSQINKDRLNTRAKNTSLEVRNKSIGEEEEINTSLGVANKSVSRKLSVSAGEEGEKNTSRGVKRKSMSRKLSVLTEEESEKNISLGVERESMSRTLLMPADEEGEIDTSRGVEKKSTGRKLSVFTEKEGEKNTSHGVKRNSMSRKLSVLAEEESEKNISLGVERESMSRTLLMSADEEGEIDTSRGVEKKSTGRKLSVFTEKEGEKNTSRGVKRKSMSRKLSVLTEEEGEKNISRSIERKSTRSRTLLVSADEDSEIDTSRGVERKSTSRKLSVSTDEEEEDQPEIFNNPGSARISGSINRTQKTREYPTDTGSQPRDTTSADNIKTTIPSDLSNENANKRKDASSTKRKSIATQNQNKTLDAAQVNYSNAGFHATEIGKLQFNSTGTISQSETNGLERSFSSYLPKEVGSIQQPDGSGLVEKLLKIKSTLDKVRNEELALMKNTKITSYFKQTSINKANVAAKDSQILPNNTKSVKKVIKIQSAPPDKAYLVNGTVYKRPKLPRPKPWVTNRLYNFLWKRLEPKYKLKTRVRSEMFVLYLSKVVALVVRRKKYKNYENELNELIEKMARLGIIKTIHDFHIFCQDFLDYDFRIKVIPMILPGSVRNIPFDPKKLHTPILNS